jgi:hypothetical protein
MPTQQRQVRYRCEMNALIDAGRGEVKVCVLEMSESGAFVEEAAGFEDQQIGDEGSLTLALPGGEPWTGFFRVTRHGFSRRELRNQRVEHVTVAAKGYGVEFVSVEDDELERLRDFLELLELR